MAKLRLSARAGGAGRPSAEQDVLHYRWFADLGSVEAQRVVGQILSAAGAQRDPAGALRYFQCARPSPPPPVPAPPRIRASPTHTPVYQAAPQPWALSP